MKSWQVPAVPTLPGSGPQVAVFDSASQQIRQTSPRDGHARLYVCGITPYDATHMGHAATYVAFDVLNRCWRDAGYTVTYVQNVTDVDDPLLERAVATGQDWRELAARETALFCEDMTALNVLPPAHYIGAVESIPLVVEWIHRLIAAGAVYKVDDDLYFRVHSDATFGEVSGYNQAQMISIFSQRGGDPDRVGKEHPLDCLLWQSARPDEPAWDSSLGHGRPGWHIECSAIALNFLGMSIDVQGGGSDLLFPHHEMGAAEAQVATGENPYAKAYVHGGMVGLAGEKMSKSKGNLVLVSRLRDSGVDPMAIRLALLAHHYRSDRDWTSEDLERAQTRLHTWRTVLEEPTADAQGLLTNVRQALAQDLNSPLALGLIDSWMTTAHDGEVSYENSTLVMQISDALLGVRV